MCRSTFSGAMGMPLSIRLYCICNAKALASCCGIAADDLPFAVLPVNRKNACTYGQGEDRRHVDRWSVGAMGA